MINLKWKFDPIRIISLFLFACSFSASAFGDSENLSYDDFPLYFGQNAPNSQNINTSELTKKTTPQEELAILLPKNIATNPLCAKPPDGCRMAPKENGCLLICDIGIYIDNCRANPTGEKRIKSKQQFFCKNINAICTRAAKDWSVGIGIDGGCAYMNKSKLPNRLPPKEIQEKCKLEPGKIRFKGLIETTYSCPPPVSN